MVQTRRSNKARKRSVPSNGPAGAAKRRQPTTMTAVSSPDDGSDDLFVRIGEDAHRHILSFALGVRASPKRPPLDAFVLYDREQHPEGLYTHGHYDQWDAMTEEEKAPYREMLEKDNARYKKETEEFKVWGRHGLVKSCRDFSLVSHLWKDVVGDVVNLHAPEVITPRELSKLKGRIATLELDSVCENFIKDVKKEWGNLSWASAISCDCSNCVANLQNVEGTPLEAVVEQFGGSFDSFAKIVAAEYTKFLLVKSVETLVASKVYEDESPSVLAWKERCQPSKIVDMMFHAHMLSPKKYAKDCTMLIGEIIDHDAGYVSPEAHSGSDFGSKKESLFSFEKQFPDKQYYDCKSYFSDYQARELFSKNFSVLGSASSIVDEMNMAEDCG